MTYQDFDISFETHPINVSKFDQKPFNYHIDEYGLTVNFIFA